MNEWTKVVTNPLGLVGFALFLVFGYLAKVNRLDERRWIAPVAMFVAIAALVGGLAIAYVQVPKAAQPSSQTSQPPSPAKQQPDPRIPYLPECQRLRVRHDGQVLVRNEPLDASLRELAARALPQPCQRSGRLQPQATIRSHGISRREAA